MMLSGTHVQAKTQSVMKLTIITAIVTGATMDVFKAYSFIKFNRIVISAYFQIHGDDAFAPRRAQRVA